MKEFTSFWNNSSVDSVIISLNNLFAIDRIQFLRTRIEKNVRF